MQIIYQPKTVKRRKLKKNEMIKEIKERQHRKRQIMKDKELMQMGKIRGAIEDVEDLKDAMSGREKIRESLTCSKQTSK